MPLYVSNFKLKVTLGTLISIGRYRSQTYLTKSFGLLRSSDIHFSRHKTITCFALFLLPLYGYATTDIVQCSGVLFKDDYKLPFSPLSRSQNSSRSQKFGALIALKKRAILSDRCLSLASAGYLDLGQQ